MTTLVFAGLMLLLTAALYRSSRPSVVRLSWSEAQRARALRLRRIRERGLLQAAAERAERGVVYGPKDPTLREHVKMGVSLLLRPQTLSEEERRQAREVVRKRTEEVIAMRRAA